jgi:RimJ/RimL family protein N-acetyltransferase
MTETPRIAPVVLEATYVRLEPLTRQHVKPLLEAATSGPRDTFGYTTVAATEPAMSRWVDEALRAHAAGHALPFAVVRRAADRVVGSTRFGNVEFWSWPPGSPNQRGEDRPDVVEIGWTWYAPDAQRTGVNTETKLLMLTHAFETWRVHCVRLKTDARNERSRQAILRIGARFDGIVRGHMIAADGTVRHSAFYSILDGEWSEVKEQLRSRLR